jgi:hypothetical protein
MRPLKSGLNGFDGYADAGGDTSSLGGSAGVSAPVFGREVGEKWRLGALARAGTRKLGTATATATATIALLGGRNTCVRAVRKQRWAALIESCGMGGEVRPGMQTADCRLQTPDSRLQTRRRVCGDGGIFFAFMTFRLAGIRVP